VVDHGNLDLFKQQLINFRVWMAVNGYQDTPLALTEFGILMPAELGFPPENSALFLTESFEWLATASNVDVGYPLDDYRLVQKWAWFSLADTIYPAPDLAELKQDKLTVIGEAFRQFMLDSQTNY
jgi:hypothetical protein